MSRGSSGCGIYGCCLGPVPGLRWNTFLQQVLVNLRQNLVIEVAKEVSEGYRHARSEVRCATRFSSQSENVEVVVDVGWYDP